MYKNELFVITIKTLAKLLYFSRPEWAL